MVKMKGQRNLGIMAMSEVTKVSIFNDKQVRKIFFNNDWYFSVVDVCSVLVV